MTDIRAKLQTVLDTALYSDGVLSYWQRKSDGTDPDEYVVYTSDGDANHRYADGVLLHRTAEATVRYYYRDTWPDTAAGRSAVRTREDQITTALTGGGFKLPSGHFDGGDIDDVGYGTTIFPVYYSEAV